MPICAYAGKSAIDTFALAAAIAMTPLQKPRLIVHVGSPKTGSTSLQASLFDSRRKLRERCDAHYASTDRPVP